MENDDLYIRLGTGLGTFIISAVFAYFAGIGSFFQLWMAIVSIFFLLVTLAVLDG